MGKKKDKFKASPFDYMGGGRVRELGDRYGVDASDYNINYGRDTGNGGREYKGDRDDYDRAVAAAAMRDYDTRRTMEARYMSGDKDAKKYAKKGFKNVGDVVAANDLMKKWHKKAGNGGSFSSASDFASMTQRAVQADRDKFIADNDAKYATKEELDALDQKEAAQAAFDDSEVELSPEVQAAKDRASAWSESGFGGNVYGDADPTATDASSGYLGGGEDEQDSSAVIPSDTEYEASQSYLSDFKNKLKDKGKFVSTI